MPISFYSPPQLTPAQSGGMPDILGNLLGGYSGVQNIRTQSLQQKIMGEQLKRSQLLAQYYPEQLQQEAQARKLKYIKEQMELDWLKSHMGGMTGGEQGSVDVMPFENPDEMSENYPAENYPFENYPNENNIPVPTQRVNQEEFQFENYTPKPYEKNAGQEYITSPESFYVKHPEPSRTPLMSAVSQNIGASSSMPPIPIGATLSAQAPTSSNVSAETPLSPFIQNEMGFQQPPTNNHPLTSHIQNQIGAPTPTYDDLMYKNVMGIDTFTPKLKAYERRQSNIQETYGKEKAKEIFDAEHDTPILERNLKVALRMKYVVDNNPEMFGHNIVEKFYPGGYSAVSKNPMAGYMQSNLIPLLASSEQQLSQRGNIVALKTAASKVPDFAVTHAVAQGRANAIVEMAQDELQRNKRILNKLPSGNKGEVVGGKYYYVNGKIYKQE